MDLMAALLNPNKEIKRIIVPSGQVNGMVAFDNEDDDIEDYPHTNDDDDYAEEYQVKEQLLYENSVKQRDKLSGSMSMVDDDLASCASKRELNALQEEQMKEVYGKYSFTNLRTDTLPIDSYRKNIIDLVNVSDVVVIEGPTGCGKTTQVPQFILDDCKNNNKPCKIAITQPRRIAAITVARRVCEERGWSFGSVCGYKVGLDTNIGPDTLLSYMTTGVLLRKLILQQNLHEYSHIIVDEVHERNQDMDFLLLIIRKFLNTNSSNTKIVLMSATFNTSEFAYYFRVSSQTNVISAPVISISKERKYKTQIYYSNQLSVIGKVPNPSFEEPCIDPETYNVFVNLLAALDRLDPVDVTTKTHVIGNVLVFLPGILEIEEVHSRMIDYSDKAKQKEKPFIEWHIIPLHSSITTEEQRKVFQSPPVGKRKVILSTNMAESSVTVTDIFYVIDFCLTKTMMMDPDTQYQCLKLQWASHINCTQRAGRVGRVCDGRVYRLVPDTFYESLPKFVTPEILRAPLHSLVLSAKMLDPNLPPKAVLALAMNPPNLSNIESTILYLKEAGGLSLTCKGEKKIQDGDLTFFGRVMAALPMDVHLSKLILLGHMFSCLDDCIIMATGCSMSIFKSPFKERLKAYTNRLQWADSSASDLIAYLNLYKVWQRQKLTSKDTRLEKEWCEKNYVSQRGMKEWSILVKEVKDRLTGLHIKQPVGAGHVVLSETENIVVIKVVICGAFYPNYFKRAADSGNEKEREAVRTLGGRDPNNTVYFTGFANENPGKLYAGHIKKYLKECASYINVSFDGSCKVYAQFSNPNMRQSVLVDGNKYFGDMPGKIRVEVYRAIRMRQLRIPCAFKIMDKKKAWKYLEKGNDAYEDKTESQSEASLSSYTENSARTINATVLPSLNVQVIRICVSEMVDAGHFWAHNHNEITTNSLQSINTVLSEETLINVQSFNPSASKYYAARFNVDKQFYRCKVLSLAPLGNKRTKTAQILFIDYGSMSTVPLDELYELPKLSIMESPPLAMECYLSEIQPSIVSSPRALWSEKVNKMFYAETSNRQLTAKIYSVVNGIIHLELYKDKNCESFENSLNYWLMKEGHAQHCEEGFLSKENHLKRLKLLENPGQTSSFIDEHDISVEDVNIEDVNPPSESLCSHTITIKGPFSPLEMQIYSIVNGGADKRVTIDSSSVNTVILDNDPQDPHDRLIVAAHIGQSPQGNLTLRHTTVMPNIDGFPMLMSLLFCPIMEMKPSENGARISAILCGLGTYADTHHSLFPNHDISIIIDTELTVDDINMLNEMRYWMNMSVQSMLLTLEGNNPPVEIEECQRELKERLFPFLRKSRKSVERDFILHSKTWGKFLYDADCLEPGNSGIADEIWPLHSTIKLNSETKKVENLEKHVIELENVALQMQPKHVSEILCKFCNEMLYSVVETRTHIATEHHKNAKKRALQEL